jgi:hypothetical protein
MAGGKQAQQIFQSLDPAHLYVPGGVGAPHADLPRALVSAHPPDRHQRLLNPGFGLSQVRSGKGRVLLAVLILVLCCQGVLLTGHTVCSTPSRRVHEALHDVTGQILSSALQHAVMCIC